MAMVGSLPCLLLRDSVHPPDGYNQSSNQDTVTRMSSRCRDSHKRLLRAKWVSRPVAPVKESWRRGDLTPFLHLLKRALLRRPGTCRKVGMKAEDEAGEGSYSPVSLGPSPLVPCPLTERPGNS